MKTGILFDLDGTLLDTLEDLADSVNHILAANGYPARTLAEVRAFVGNGAGQLIRKAAPEGADVEALLAQFQRYYAGHCQIKTRPYPGILEALAELSRNYPLAIVSNKPDAAVKALCAQYFPGIPAMGETAQCPRKPAPDMVLRAMAELSVERCIYVGDSEVDIQTAHNAQVPCLSVLWGFRSRYDLLEAGGSETLFCDSTEELVKRIEELTCGQ